MKGILMTEHDKVLELIRLKDQAPINLDLHKTALLAIRIELKTVEKVSDQQVVQN
jgi:hypothetical protein